MSKHDLIDLEDEEMWDFDQGTVHPPSKTARAIVPVAFEGDDFKRVAMYARKRGVKLSDFIRKAALERVDTDQPDISPNAADADYPDPLD